MTKTFNLGSKIYTVVEKEFDDNKQGSCYPELGRIFIANKLNGIDIPTTSKQQTLYHELIHVVLHELGYFDLSRNEQLVQQIAILLHQFETTKQ